MKITVTRAKEVQTIVKYKCDICNKTILMDELKPLYVNTVAYSLPGGVWQERTDNYENHVCSLRCLRICLKRAVYGADIHLTNKLIQELIGESEVKQNED